MTLPRTPSQTVGPFFTIGLCRRAENELVPDGVRLAGRLLDGRDEPVVDGVIEIFDAANRLWGRCGTDPEGRFRFVVPRNSTRLEAYVFARGLLKHQLTRIELSDLPREDDTLSFDIRLQGERQTVFFAV
jgi:protocatechuate 3,4-dioxygenase alpha subunit